MRLLLSRAFSTGRQTALQTSSIQPSLFQRASILPTVQTASIAYQSKISYKLKPLEKPTNPNSKKKIPDRSRPLKRTFIPPPTKSEQELATLPYIVRRTPSTQLPIYRKFMSGGTRIIILIKRVDGNRRQLVDDLAKDLELEKDAIRLNPTTQHIEIKGNHFERALDWLLAKGY